MDYLLKKLRETGTVERKIGSGRRRSKQNINAVEDLIVSQEDKPRTHRSTRQIARETGVTEFCSTNCQQRPVAEMFQTTQSPGTDRIQQVGTFITRLFATQAVREQKKKTVKYIQGHAASQAHQS